MIKYTPHRKGQLPMFRTPFDQQLDPKNRWVIMADLVPWDELATVFFDSLSHNHGRATIDLRIILGALMVKHLEDLSDEATILYIQENIYAQFFVGLTAFQRDPVFSSSLFVEIRRRLGKKGSDKLNEILILHAHKLKAIRHKPTRKAKSDGSHGGLQESARNLNHTEQNNDIQVEQTEFHNTNSPATHPSDPSASEESTGDQAAVKTQATIPNRGVLYLDATVAPQYISFPTDSRLLCEARVILEAIIDSIFDKYSLWQKKPRTYRRLASQNTLAFLKKRKHTKAEINKFNKYQLRLLKRNLHTINKMWDKVLAEGADFMLTQKQYFYFLVIQHVYAQQLELASSAKRSVEDRIVSLHQPWVRPIVRGKAGKNVEFGAKINIAMTEKMAWIDHSNFDNFNEGLYLQQAVERYKANFGYFPQSVLVDRIYLNRENRNYLKDNGINHSGVPLGRKPVLARHTKKLLAKIQNKRVHIEGFIGEAKTTYGLERIKMRRRDTTFAALNLIMLVMNLVTLSKAFSTALFFAFYSALQQLRRAILATCNIPYNFTIHAQAKIKSQWEQAHVPIRVMA